MSELLSIFVIAVALSMDTFSVSLGLGVSKISKKKMLVFSIIVGCLHFIMPILGNLLGLKIVELFSLNTHFLLGLILVYLAITMIIESLKCEHKPKTLNAIELIFLAIAVSIDSFSTGLGISALSNNIFMCVTIFSITSFLFTYAGLLIGKYATKLLGIYATIIGSVLLLLIGIFNLCK